MRSPLMRTSPAVGSISFRMAFPAVDLPQPLSPTSPKRLARGDVEGDAVDRMDLADGALQQAFLDREMLDQSSDGKERGAAPTHSLPRMRGRVRVGAAQRLDRGHAAATRSEWKQAAKWPGSFSSKAGISRRQMSVAKAQRVSNGQPGIGSLRDGTVPAISASRGTRS